MNATDKKVAFKASLKNACLDLLEQRIAHASQAMDQAQESANSQEKSSSGDKYETSRAMGQLDKNMNARQLAQAREELGFLEAISISPVHTLILPGAVFNWATNSFLQQLD